MFFNTVSFMNRYENKIDINKIDINIVIAIINLAFIVYIYRKDKKDKIEDEAIKRKSFWFRNIVLEKNINELELLWEKAHEIFEVVLENSGEIQENRIRVDKVIDIKRKIVVKLNSFVGIIDEDMEINLDYILDDFEDFYTNIVSELTDTRIEDKELILNKFTINNNSFKEAYFKSLYKFELNGYSYIPLDIYKEI